MLTKVLPIMHILATYYHIECFEPKDSQEKNDQPSMPTAYEAINNYEYEFDLFYSTPNPVVHTSAERIAIQYAPLEMTDSNNHKHTHAPNRTEPPTTEQKLQELEEKDYLQPVWSTVKMIDRQQKPRSFFSGHDVSVLQSNSNVGPRGHDLYRTYHNHVGESRVRNSEYTSFQNPKHGTPEEELLPDGRTVLYLPGTGDIMPLQEKKYIRKVVPFVRHKPFLRGALAKSQGALSKSSAPEQLQNINTEKPLTVVIEPISALSPGLHLNLARVYGIAHPNDQRHIDVPHRWEKPAIMNRKSVDKKKIILHPLPQYTKSIATF